LLDLEVRRAPQIGGGLGEARRPLAQPAGHLADPSLIVDSNSSIKRSIGVSLPSCEQCQRTRRRWMRPLIESTLEDCRTC
jgi:hypothetical protein